MGNDGDIDFLYFGYNGNQIQWIFDDGGNSNLYNMKEYVERHYSYDNPITEFFYDANGNMTADLDRDIVTIKYNLLNLPELIQFKKRLPNQTHLCCRRAEVKFPLHYRECRRVSTSESGTGY